DVRAALDQLKAALDKGTTFEKQAALETLGGIKVPVADGILLDWLEALVAKKVPAELQLDLLEAAGKRNDPDIKKKLAAFEAARSKTDPLAAYRESLVGGDAEQGRRIFFFKSEVSCLRCHKIKGEGGEVGPDLFGLAAKQPREYLLEAIVSPNAKIAENFDTLVVTLTNGKFLTGILKKDDGKQLQLMTPEGKLLVIPKDEVDFMQKGKSAMPEDLLKHLSKRDIRDLVEFLATQK
ncbi:MAG: c-type cytochrome, partial [Gemmataceae bacterium]